MQFNTQNNHEKGNIVYLIIFLHTLFGSAIPIGKKLLQFTTPIFLTGSRMVIAGALLLGYIAYTSIKNKPKWHKRDIWLYLQVIFFGIYLKYILRYSCLNYLAAGKMAFLLNITPFVAALFSYFLFNERLSRKQLLGLVIGFFGIIPILLTSSSPEQLWGELAFISWPEFGVLLAVACHCYGMVIIRKLIREKKHSSITINGIRMFGGGLLALITAFFVEGLFPVNNISSFFGWLAALILISNIICHNLYIYLLNYYSITFLSFTDFLSPLFAAFYGWLFLKEIITWHYYFSAIVVFAGLYLFYQDELKEVKKIA